MRVSIKSAAVAGVVIAALGVASWTWTTARERENEREVYSLQASAMAYNVKLFGLGAGTIEFHLHDGGVLVACGMTFTAVSKPDNTLIASVAPVRVTDWCSERDDIVYVTDLSSSTPRAAGGPLLISAPPHGGER